MEKYSVNLFEVKKRLFVLGDPDLEKIKNSEIKILVTPFSPLDENNIDIPKEKYYTSIIDAINNYNNPLIILEDYNLDRIIIESLNKKTNSPRIFIQSSKEKGPYYYKNKNELEKIVENINPKKICIGGAFLSPEEKKNPYWLEDTCEDSSFVGYIYSLFAKKYPTCIDYKLTKVR